MLARRDLLRLGGISAAAVATTGCDAVAGRVSELLGGGIPERIVAPAGESIDPAHHLLDRAAFGPWPGDVERVRAMGSAAWIEQQLHPDEIDDWACLARTAWIDVARLPADLVAELRPEHVESQLETFTLLQATYSDRQLQEVMVRFWSDHFNIAMGKSWCQWLKPSHDRDVIRKHALGKFRDLLGACSLSPAMLVYLDGRDNKVTDAGDRPNENQARELFELHGLGVHGGYTQRDVMEAARCMSGFIVHEEWTPGRVEFVPERHDDGEKVVLGTRIEPGGGEGDMEGLLDLVAGHPSCARYIATKLCRWFVSDDPPSTIVDAATVAFAETDGDIKAVVRTILRSPEFEASAGIKLKRPFRFVVSALRAVGADTHARTDLSDALGRMGQPLFEYPTPDGYPTEPGPWLGTLLWRWNFALALCEGRLEAARVDLPRLTHAIGERSEVAAHLLGRRPDDRERSAIADADSELAAALMLCSPRFQRH